MIQAYPLKQSGEFPNNAALPLLIYPDAFPADVNAATVTERFRENRWQGIWVNGVFSYHHFHSNAHEVLGCFSGSATVRFGGPEGMDVEISAGAAVVIPAGVAHCKLEGSDDFGVVGAYPEGPVNDLHADDHNSLSLMRATIAAVPLPDTDPVYGREGPLFEHWTPDHSNRD